jgi:hypothetical protein
VELKKKFMKNGEKKNFEVGDIWFDDSADAHYLILDYRDGIISIKWLDLEANEMPVNECYCYEDEFIRKISSLEKELL